MSLFEAAPPQPAASALAPLLLSYTVTPGSVPTSSDPNHPVTANLTLSVTNGTGQAVKCAAIAFVLPVGSGAGELTATPGAIMASPAAGTTWTIAPDAQVPGGFTATPSGDVTLAPNASLSFTLAGVLVNGTAGLVALSVYEASDPASAIAAQPTKRQGSLLLTKADTGLAITNFVPSAWSVTAGQPCVLSWQTTAADSCVLSWDGGNHAVPTSGTQTVNPALTTPYTLTAIGGGGSVTSQITVSVPVQVSFSGPTDSVKIGGPATLSWQIAGATTGTLAPVDSGQDPVVSAVGSRDVHPASTTTYTLTASASGGGTVSAPVTVVVDPIPHIDCFAVSPPSGPAVPGSAFTLSWQTNGKTVIDQGIGEVARSGSLVVHPTSTTTYTLTCSNHNGPVTNTVTAQVLPPTIEAFAVGPSSDGSGKRSVYWSTLGMVRYELGIYLNYCISGQLPPTGAVVEFQIPNRQVSFYGQFFDAQDQLTEWDVNYGLAPTAPPMPPVDDSWPQIRYFWVSPDPFTGGSLPNTLHWKFVGATQGVINPGNVSVGPTGQMPIDPTVSYSLTVTGANGETAEASLRGRSRAEQMEVAGWLSQRLQRAPQHGASEGATDTPLDRKEAPMSIKVEIKPLKSVKQELLGAAIGFIGYKGVNGAVFPPAPVGPQQEWSGCYVATTVEQAKGYMDAQAGVTTLFRCALTNEAQQVLVADGDTLRSTVLTGDQKAAAMKDALRAQLGIDIAADQPLMQALGARNLVYLGPDAEVPEIIIPWGLVAGILGAAPFRDYNRANYAFTGWRVHGTADWQTMATEPHDDPASPLFNWIDMTAVVPAAEVLSATEA